VRTPILSRHTGYTINQNDFYESTISKTVVNDLQDRNNDFYIKL